LTNQGHVLKFDSLSHEESTPRGQWSYLANFSEVDRVREHPVFTPPDGKERLVSEVPKTMQITHVSAHFQTFVAYSTGSSSIVLMGNQDCTVDSQPTILPQLQNKGVISVVLGDYHYGALTADGKLYTWGHYSKGALGLGDPAYIKPGQPGGFLTKNDREIAVARRRGEPPNVSVPTEVRFDHEEKERKNMFCFAAAAAGWHMGALAIDLETKRNEDSEDSDSEGPHMPGYLSSLPSPAAEVVPDFGPGGLPTFGRGAGIFRVGFAGRGRFGPPRSL